MTRRPARPWQNDLMQAKKPLRSNKNQPSHLHGVCGEKARKARLAGQNILATGSARAHPPGGKTGRCCGAGRFRKAPPSESGEGEDDDREQEQETEREARDCEQAVWNAVNEHAIAPRLPRWVAAGAARY